MTEYTYTIIYTDTYGNRNTVGIGTEEQMFRTALALDKEGAILETVRREVWTVTDHIAHFERFEPYRNGKPITA